MPDTIQQLNADIAALKATSSGLIDLTSLDTVLNRVAALLSGRTGEAADTTALQALDPTEAGFVYVQTDGLYVYDANASTGDFPAIGGGYWNKQFLTSMADLSDVSIHSLADAQVLKWNTSTGKYENANQSVPAIGWVNVTSKPNLFILDANKNMRMVGTSNLPALFDVAATAGNILTLLKTALAGVILKDNNIIATQQASLITSNPPTELTNVIIIGDVGKIDNLRDGANLHDLIVVGVSGKAILIQDQFGNVHIGKLGANITPDPAGKPTQIFGDSEVQGKFYTTDDAAVDGNIDVTGTAHVAGAVAIDGAMSVGTTLGVAGNTTLGGTLHLVGAALLDGVPSYASRAAAATALNLGGVAGTNGGKLFRNTTIGCLDIT